MPDPENDKMYHSKYFHDVYESSPPPHKFTVRVGFSVDAVKNLDPPHIFNETCLCTRL